LAADAHAAGPGGRYRALSLVCPSCHAALAEGQGEMRCPSCARRYPERDGVLQLVAGARGAPGYDPHYFSSLPLVERDHFWFVTRREAIVDALRRSVPDLSQRALVDIGCGSGGLLEFLEAQGLRVAGACDAYAEGLVLARRRTAAPLLLVDEGRFPPLGPGQRLLAMFDVLEHLDDDRGTLGWLASVLEPGGFLVLTVPAHPFLFDEMDELACHRRRYSSRDLRAKLEGAGLEVVQLTHLMAQLVPALVLARALGRRLRRQPASERRAAELRVVPGLNGLLRATLRLERAWTRLGSLPFGTSLLAVARRPTGTLRTGAGFA
jgi:2-polyprenyl-3-methyl-5-hydroxy-6-metoxy-1,4-benzoquinol methylase